MKHLSNKLLSELVVAKRKEKNISQVQLSEATGINCFLLLKVKKVGYRP